MLMVLAARFYIEDRMLIHGTRGMHYSDPTHTCFLRRNLSMNRPMSQISAIFGTDDDEAILNSLYLIANVRPSFSICTSCMVR